MILCWPLIPAATRLRRQVMGERIFDPGWLGADHGEFFISLREDLFA